MNVADLALLLDGAPRPDRALRAEGKETAEGGPGQKRTPSRPLSAPEEGLEEGETDSLAERN